MPDLQNFEQISTKPGFMKHNGGLLFRNVSEKENEFKSTINVIHLNDAKITHGGYIAALIDAGADCCSSFKWISFVTISLDLKFIGASTSGDEIIGKVKILKS